MKENTLFPNDTFTYVWVEDSLITKTPYSWERKVYYKSPQGEEILPGYPETYIREGENLYLQVESHFLESSQVIYSDTVKSLVVTMDENKRGNCWLLFKKEQYDKYWGKKSLMDHSMMLANRRICFLDIDSNRVGQSEKVFVYSFEDFQDPNYACSEVHYDESFTILYLEVQYYKKCLVISLEE
ncbi:MAG: hypothetical protein SF052_16150 [Bacteroidia bacterium]|nr:hypothetical protein [Bacteroidia bacterium]